MKVRNVHYDLQENLLAVLLDKMPFCFPQFTFQCLINSSAEEESYDKVLRNILEERNFDVFLLCLARYQRLHWSLWLYNSHLFWGSNLQHVSKSCFPGLPCPYIWGNLWLMEGLIPSALKSHWNELRVLIAKIRPNSWDAICRSDQSSLHLGHRALGRSCVGSFPARDSFEPSHYIDYYLLKANITHALFLSFEYWYNTKQECACVD